MAQNTQDHTDDAIAVALSDPDAGAPPAYANAEPLSGMPKPPRRSGIAWAGIVAALIWVGGAVGYLIGYAGIDLSTNILATQTGARRGSHTRYRCRYSSPVYSC